MVTILEVQRAIHASNDILEWALKTYPELKARGLPNVLATYATAAAIFRESGYTWYERSGEEAFVLRTTFTEKYGSVIPFNRSRWLVRKGKAVTYWAVKESYVKFMAHAKYYLPTPDEIEEMLNYTQVQRLSLLLVMPTSGVMREVVEKVVGGGVVGGKLAIPYRQIT